MNKTSSISASPTEVNHDIRVRVKSRALYVFHQKDSIKAPPPNPNPPLTSPQVQMIHGLHNTLVEGVVFLRAAVQTRVVHATGSFDIAVNMKTWNIVIDHRAHTNQIAPWFVWS